MTFKPALNFWVCVFPFLQQASRSSHDSQRRAGNHGPSARIARRLPNVFSSGNCRMRAPGPQAPSVSAPTQRPYFYFYCKRGPNGRIIPIAFLLIEMVFPHGVKKYTRGFTSTRTERNEMEPTGRRQAPGGDMTVSPWILPAFTLSLCVKGNSSPKHSSKGKSNCVVAFVQTYLAIRFYDLTRALAANSFENKGIE
ncbi:hypothetical protein DL96DRAFT_537489 [Flagelloscypha sp. PMI_526]|nr:hypothetical protein DL96DRAFT_537489 [Flagelloscypha sp. PMI_526]